MTQTTQMLLCIGPSQVHDMEKFVVRKLVDSVGVGQTWL